MAGARGDVRRVAMLSMHTSPIEQPGTGDAGGMNVYVLETCRWLADAGVEVDVFTRSTSSDLPPVVEVCDGVVVRNLAAGPHERLDKAELPSQLCEFARDVLRAEAEQPAGHYDVIHSHYWLSGQAGLVASDRWSVPLVHSMHTMAKVKNAALATGDAPEPSGRILGEEHLVASADRLIANTAAESDALIRMYGAAPERIDVVHPGVDLSTFRPRSRAACRREVDIPEDADVVLFAGRIQPLKAPDLLLRAMADAVLRQPALRDRLVIAVVGGPSGSGTERPDSLVQLADELDICDLVRFVPPVDRGTLARWYAAASVVCVPSYSESFGLVALEAQACGTPVVAARVGGLATAVRDGVTGTLVGSHDPADYATAIGALLNDPALAGRMGAAGVRHAAGFGWQRTAMRTLDVYRAAAGRHAAYGSEVAS